MCIVKPIIKIMNRQCLKLDPKPGDLTIVRIVRQEVIYVNVVKFYQNHI